MISSEAISVFVINEKVLRRSVFSGYARFNKLFVFVWPREIQKTSQKVESYQGSKKVRVTITQPAEKISPPNVCVSLIA